MPKKKGETNTVTDGDVALIATVMAAYVDNPIPAVEPHPHCMLLKSEACISSLFFLFPFLSLFSFS